MQDITLEKIDRISKGRNGWFKARRITLREWSPELEGAAVNIEVWSKNEREKPPIELNLSKADAMALGASLIEFAGGAYLCHGCGRESENCSADPCARVEADREVVCA